LIAKRLNRQLGYCFPTDEELAERLEVSLRMIGRGMKALEDADLIERWTRVKRDKKREAIGRVRRIYLTLPNQANKQKPSERAKASGRLELKGQNQAGERPTVVQITPDRTTPDKEIRREKKRNGAVPEREDVPSLYRNDIAFLDTFDKTVMDMTDGKPIGAGEMERIVQQAFDQTTNSSKSFMPFHWNNLCDRRFNDPTAAEWFRQRAGQLIHRRPA
jgi:hypothetical protein